MKSIIRNIHTELTKHIDPVYKAGSGRFSKEVIHSLGVRTPLVRKIARQYYKEVAALPKTTLFSLCEQLFEQGTAEEHTIAWQWAYERRAEYTTKDFARFERWLKKYVSNWADCDDFCTHAFGYLIWKYPELTKHTISWRMSTNRWLRRAAAVIFIHPMWTKDRPVEKQSFLKTVFETADTLFLDTDDLVQKGYGWMLKATADMFPAEVFAYVMKHKTVMPRTALRYAIEKFPKEMKRAAMQP
ncbi:MAG: DNA alkylation repair protein [Candidatus Magasanikbacteria bacterium]|nr:DNA alkylation repair protein [Candidatus Magasanikbacteria bacterium]NCS72177.1 DNA alkylation repair protein [Candidatus Magasanikbacteria bacterium]